MYHKTQEFPEKSGSVLGSPALPALGHAVAGSTGAAVSNVITYPLALIITRLQTQRQLRNSARSPHSREYRSIRDAVRKIYEREGGLNGYYIGVFSDTSKTIADSFLFFLAYTYLRQTRMRTKPQSKHLPAIDELSVGFIAGAFSKFWTTPIANVVTRKQTASMLTDRHPNKQADQGSIRAISQQIYQENGLQGFWSGYSASLILTLNPSLTFFFFETLKRALLYRGRRINPTPQAVFLLAALSKVMASTVTYPFQLAKSRLQASGRNNGEADSKESSGETYDRRSLPQNVFTTILRIARNEGLGALYEGLHGEILKGFFSHGITMIIKDVVHKLVIQFYYILLKMLRRYPSPPPLIDMVKEQAKQTEDTVKVQAQQVLETAKEGLQTISTKVDHSGDNTG